MSLEGRLRDLALPELCQLLGSSRKSGVLRVYAPLQARTGSIHFINGMIAEASVWSHEAVDARHETPVPAPSARSAQAVERCALDLMTWHDGDFRFEADASASMSESTVRLNVDSLLVEAAHRAETWESLRDRVPNANAVPAFVDIDPQQLPLLRLVPQEWEVLTRVDGRRDIELLATALGRNVIDVAVIVHALIGAGVLALRDVDLAPRRHPTPPAQDAIVLWPTLDLMDDSTGAIPENAGDAAIADRFEVGGTDVESYATVASGSASTSTMQRDAVWPELDADAATLCAEGDRSALRGDLAAALSLWSAALRGDVTHVDADRIREAIALAARLHALLHPA